MTPEQRRNILRLNILRLAQTQHLASLVALTGYLLLTCLATHPLWQNWSDAVPGDVGDPALNTHILAWDTHALVIAPLALFDANFYYPLPNTLAYSENLVGNALIALPVALFTGEPVVAYNFTFMLGFVLSGFAMYLLTLRLTHRRFAAFVAGVGFAFAPYRLGALAHIQLIALQWLPLALCVLAQIVENRSGAKRLVLFLIFLWLQIASTLHGALFALLVVGVWLAFNLPRLTGAISRFGVVALVVFGLSLLPLAMPYLSVLTDLRQARPPDVAVSFLAAPTDWLAASGANHLFGTLSASFRIRQGFNEEQTLFMGIITPLLALLGLLRWRKADDGSNQSRWKPAFVILLVVSVCMASSAWLLQAIPVSSVMRVPARWGAVVSFALAGLSGFGVASAEGLWGTSNRRRELLGWLARLAVVLLVFAEGFSAPIPIARIGNLQSQNRVYHYLAQLPGRDAVVELPLYAAPDAEYPEGKRMYASALHWRSLVNGYSGFTPPRQTALAAELKNFPDEQSLMALRELGRQGVRYVVVHSGEPGLPRREWVQVNRAKAQQSGLLHLVGSFDDNDLFEIVP